MKGITIGPAGGHGLSRIPTADGGTDKRHSEG